MEIERSDSLINQSLKISLYIDLKPKKKYISFYICYNNLKISLECLNNFNF
jgi:hypothetical protein